MWFWRYLLQLKPKHSKISGHGYVSHEVQICQAFPQQDQWTFCLCTFAVFSTLISTLFTGSGYEYPFNCFVLEMTACLFKNFRRKWNNLAQLIKLLFPRIVPIFHLPSRSAGISSFLSFTRLVLVSRLEGVSERVFLCFVRTLIPMWCCVCWFLRATFWLFLIQEKQTVFMGKSSVGFSDSFLVTLPKI